MGVKKPTISRIRNLISHSLTVLRVEGFDRLFLYAVRYLSWKLQVHRIVRSLPTQVATAVYVLLKLIIRRTVWLLNKIYPHKYTDTDPYKVIYVDPSTIERTTGSIFSKRRGWVMDGDWDTNGGPYMQRPYAKAIEQRFTDGLDWSDTVLADKYTASTLQERANSIERLYHSIRDEGYKSQHELLGQNPETAWNGLNDAMHPLANEVAVDIGRNGELLWNICGQHRLAIAKVLEIDKIPVQVFRRHEEWQKIRDQARRDENIPTKLKNHPDLSDIIEY